MPINAGDAIIKIGGDAGDLENELKKVDSAVDETCAGIEENFTAAGAIVAAFGVAVIAALSMAVKAAADFEKGMREVNTMMGLTQQQFVVISEEVRIFSIEMGVNAVEATHALYQAISAGVPKENVLDFLRVATKAAIGGVTDTETAVDGLTTVINAFKLSIEDAQWVADIMFTTVKGGKTTFDELAQSLFNVAPIAKASGVSFEEVAAALATMTKQGVPTSVATTQLRAAIQAMTAPTVRQEKYLKELGLEMSKTTMETEGLAAMMDKLFVATGGNMGMLRKVIGSVEGVQAVLALAGENADMFAADLAAMSGAAGASQAAFEEMEKSLSRRLEKMREGFMGLAIAAGDVLAPYIGFVIDKINELIRWMSTLNPVLLKVITIGFAVGGMLALMGGGLLMVAGLAPTLAKAIGFLTTATFPKMVASLRIVIIAMWRLVASFLATLAALGPVGWAMLATGVALLATGIILASKYANQATQDLEGTGEAAGDLTLSLEGGTTALADYQAELGGASSGLGDLESSALGAADAQGELASGIKSTTGAIIESTSAARALAMALGDIMAYAATFPGGMTMEQLEAFSGTGKRGVILPSGEELEWAEYLKRYYPKEYAGEEGRYIPALPPLPEYQHGALLTEPTLLWGLRSMRPFGVAGEAGPEQVGPTLQPTTITNHFSIASLVVREESDIDKIAQSLHDLQERKYRTLGTRR